MKSSFTPSSLWISLGIGALTGFASVSWGQILLDEGAPTQSLFIDGNTAPFASSVLGAAILGGERDIEITSVNSASGVSAYVGPGSVADTVVLETNRGSNRAGTISFVWDGIDGSPLLFHTGLGGLDLAATSTHLEFFLTKDAVVTTWEFEFYSDAGNASSYVLDLPAGAVSSVHYQVPFTSFSAISGGGADFSNIGAIRFRNSSSALASDSNLENLRFMAVPEPTALALLGLGMLPLLRRRRGH